MAKRKKKPVKYLVEAKGPDADVAPSDLLKGRQQRYLMVNVLARRARELNRGVRSLLEEHEGLTTTEIALEEVKERKLDLKRKQKSRVLVNMIPEE